jgi:hypothetical protein
MLFLTLPLIYIHLVGGEKNMHKVSLSWVWGCEDFGREFVLETSGPVRCRAWTGTYTVVHAGQFWSG